MPDLFRMLPLFGALLVAPPALGAARERAIEQIPELMGRILDSQEEIRERESELTPVVERYDRKLVDSKKEIESASSEQHAAEALVDYVEAYASRLEAQEAGLRSIEPALVRMRADARDLIRAAAVARSGRGASKEEQKEFFREQFQGVALATGELAERLERQEEASTTGAVLHASWASHGALQLPIPELGSDGAVSFARKVDGLHARYQARTNQLAAEKRAVQRLLDLLIERQLALRLDQLFAGSASIGLGALLAGDGKSQDWQDLGSVVSRTLGLPADGGVYFDRRTASMEHLDYFAHGVHRE